MNLSTRANEPPWSLARHVPVLALLDPGRLALPAAVSLVAGLAAAVALYRHFGLPLWTTTLVVLLALLPVGVHKWRQDRRRYGTTTMLLSMMLVTQGVHTIEHVAQWVQYYVLYLPARQSNGLLSAANAEWVHFVWNWAVLIAVIVLLRGGMRNAWAMLLLVVAAAHSLEHTYLFIRHLMVLGELHRLEIYSVTAQSLPGIIGRDGWLARGALTRNTFVCSLPGLTTAMRLDVHFWWNLIEMFLLLGAASVFLKGRLVKEQPSLPAE